MTVKVAVIQSKFSNDVDSNIIHLNQRVVEAAVRGAQIILMPELPSYWYFCKRQDPAYFAMAETLEECKLIGLMRKIAKEYQVVLPTSFFEKVGNTCFNSVAMIDADGSILGIYRKSHIPDGAGYQEKYYFSPGKSGFKVWQTRYAKVGCAICWDQWFPEAARIMALKGADLLLYPTAIGSEPHLPDYDSKDHWQRTMQGHAAANMVPVLAANRYGEESDSSIQTTFYGSSFITDGFGQKIAESPRQGDDILYASFNLKKLQENRFAWGLFRDRRPELYHDITAEA
ncbi:N-carbamoylputrescine amidase [Fastidiosibacter lacustris]|uniref:N-carbamoylputrescine amidase n=1 Tax=Fastidiosibacter lacustris TaxID=2056695 RepID=UPI000E34D94D|nr:N-carbamoylputrescine amidase [Fastidiosibacter lacustris]